MLTRIQYSFAVTCTWTSSTGKLIVHLKIHLPEIRLLEQWCERHIANWTSLSLFYLLIGVMACPIGKQLSSLHNLLVCCVETEATFLYCCPDCPSCQAQLNSMGWTTWAIWAAMKKKRPHCHCYHKIHNRQWDETFSWNIHILPYHKNTLWQ